MIYHMIYKRNNKILFTNKYKHKRTLLTGIKLNEPSNSPNCEFKRINEARGNIDTLSLKIPAIGFTVDNINSHNFDKIFKDIDKLVQINSAA